MKNVDRFKWTIIIYCLLNINNQIQKIYIDFLNKLLCFSETFSFIVLSL